MLLANNKDAGTYFYVVIIQYEKKYISTTTIIFFIFIFVKSLPHAIAQLYNNKYYITNLENFTFRQTIIIS